MGMTMKRYDWDYRGMDEDETGEFVKAEYALALREWHELAEAECGRHRTTIVKLREELALLEDRVAVAQGMKNEAQARAETAEAASRAHREAWDSADAGRKRAEARAEAAEERVGREQRKAWKADKAAERAESEAAALRAEVAMFKEHDEARDIDRNELRAEVERLRNERDEAEVERGQADAAKLAERKLRIRGTRVLARIVKYAREDRATTPGSTRLARALEGAQALLDGQPEAPTPYGTPDESPGFNAAKPLKREPAFVCMCDPPNPGCKATRVEDCVVRLTEDDILDGLFGVKPLTEVPDLFEALNKALEAAKEPKP